ncbi:glucan biosynthesis protein [Steroidobacter sp.]|uniref:glucan biosynthesis protein n=1 Tax=Steroidobacter sp. TaxID=1978227 RepID=UPI001A43EBDB|nr:glucan biosynthesis protein D [Steroidobacter sp.]MBL8271776.1 glucan biosynthesis protein D [Steroidobacter sp.]
MLRRRDFLQSAVALSTLSATGLANAAAPATRGPAKVFDYASLKGQARAMATKTFQPPAKLAPKVLVDLGYDEYQSIRFHRDEAVWGDVKDANFRLEFFHMGRGFKEPVRLYEIVDGQAREILYRPDMFDLSRSGVNARSLPKDLSFAGFRIHTVADWERDVASFLGASYFRSVGSDTRQFGLSARGLAIDTALDPEEFPRFSEYYFERPKPDAQTLVIYGLLDSPSVTGAYRFALTPGAPQVVEVDAAVYPRKAIRRLGIAALTSMYQVGENDKRMGYDWRPEIHDSDGLQLYTGNGEWLWRPLNNPATLRFNSFLDENPRGFGLLQRDRDFHNYQDDGVFYERRPSLWIEPKSPWGKGSVQLTEIPTVDETFDNIVAFWNPATPAKAGDELLYSYRMYWGTQMPIYPTLAQAVATRTGLGGVVGQRRRYFSWRFAIDFEGGELATLPERAKVEPVISVSRGEVEITSARPLQHTRGYRAMFDVKLPDDSMDPVDIRLFLRVGHLPLSETWPYQWSPPTPQERLQFLRNAGH